jgi:hypothetical protein
MPLHNKISFAREYCRCHAIPYQVRGEALFIKGKQICFSLFNLAYADILRVIDGSCDYDHFGRFVGLR